MLNNHTTESELFRTALGPGPDCPPIEELESLLSPESSQTDLAVHVKSCLHCQTELHLLQTFQAEGIGERSPEVRRTAALLQKRSQKILRQSDSAPAREPWWKAAFTIRSLAQASLGLAMLLAVVGITIRFRTVQPPSLNGPSQVGQDVFRSGSFALISPSGDLNQPPSEIRWEKVPNAASYQAHLMEVDRNELWKAETKEDHIALPPSIRLKIVPAKTLYCEIDAYDASGKKVGETGLVRFRLLQSHDGH